MIVNLKGTFSKDQRPNNGLDTLAEYMNAHRLTRVPVVGFVEYHKLVDEVGRPQVLTVEVGAIEPLLSTDGADANGSAEQGWQLLDQARKLRGLGTVEDTLFDHPAGPDYDDEDGEPGGQMRLGQDGPHPVPPPSGEELTAELDERRKGKTPPPAEFSGGTDD